MHGSCMMHCRHRTAKSYVTEIRVIDNGSRCRFARADSEHVCNEVMRHLLHLLRLHLCTGPTFVIGHVTISSSGVSAMVRLAVPADAAAVSMSLAAAAASADGACMRSDETMAGPRLEECNTPLSK
jgi:hypothetical protein